jgi:phage-related minor tail protein
MEDVVNRIIAIDNETKKVIEMTERIKKNSDLDLKHRISELEKELMEESKIVADNEFKSIIQQAIEEVNIIEENEKSKINKIENLYKSKKRDLVEGLFQSLLKQNE